MLHPFAESLDFLMHERDQLVITLIVDNPIKLIAIIPDDADRIDRDVVDPPGALDAMETVVYVHRVLLFGDGQIGKDLSVVWSIERFAKIIDPGQMSFLLNPLNRVILQFAQERILDERGEERNGALPLLGSQAAPMIAEGRLGHVAEIKMLLGEFPEFFAAGC